MFCIIQKRLSITDGLFCVLNYQIVGIKPDKLSFYEEYYNLLKLLANFIAMRIDQQTLKDLEFDRIRMYLSNYCKSEKARSNAKKIKPLNSPEDLKREFAVLKEIQEIHHRDDVNFPHASSQDIDHALKVLRVENGVLILEELVRVYKLCIGTEELIRFAKKHKEELPNVFIACQHIDRVDNIIKIIKSILNKRMEIDDKASKDLEKIRRQLKSYQTDIDKNFDSAIKRYRKLDFLDAHPETFIDNKRLLTVVSAHKSKVKGRVRGVSAKGNLSYIEPFENIDLNKRYEQLIIEEKNELFKILQAITFELREEKKNLDAFERLLSRFDLYNAKVLMADEYAGIIPKTSNKKGFYWEDALHPILYKTNKDLGVTTIGQNFELHEKQRFLVISGPNAGGKSITLKTVGLLQVMYQAALFVPVKDVSEFCWFDQLMSDIGDNQSIENQLSTYSYRLSRMKFFLDKLDHNSLVLLDEFGSGSDPELGGALAEVFYEEMYDRKCFAVINTHYTNIKILTSKKEEAINAFMLFDTKELKPLFKLSVGQPGSSFTFEVARINGIQDNLIKRAQGKVSEHKVNLDQLAIDLQREKSEFNKANKLQNIATKETNELTKKYEEKLQDLYEKTNQQHRFFEQKSKFLKAGKKLFDLIRKHKGDETNKELNEAMKKYIAVEKKRALETTDAVVLDKTIKEVLVEKPSAPKPRRTKGPTIPQKKKAKVGSRVKIPGYNRTGEVQSIKGNSAEVLIGNFKVKAKLVDLEVFT